LLLAGPYDHILTVRERDVRARLGRRIGRALIGFGAPAVTYPSVRSITPALDDEGAWRAIKRKVSAAASGVEARNRRSMVRVIGKCPQTGLF
jgi:hypothetical protein